jgi:ketosteroid isomerase-like protein
MIMNNAVRSRAGVAVVAALVMATGCRIERTPQSDPADPANVARAEIEITLREYRAALAAGDMRRAAAVFTPAAHLHLPDVPDIRGRGEIDEALTARFAHDSIVGMDMQFEGIDVDGGTAHQFGTFHQTLRDTAGVERTLDGHFAIRWVRAGDSVWRIERMLLQHAPAAADSAANES